MTTANEILNKKVPSKLGTLTMEILELASRFEEANTIIAGQAEEIKVLKDEIVKLSEPEVIS